MNRKDLVVLLVLQILTAVFAVMCFKYIDDRFSAVVAAGTSFVVIGLIIIWRTGRWKNRMSSLTFWAGNIHLWIFAIPMLGRRLMMGEDFSIGYIFGMPSMVFHRLAEIFYMIMIVATLIDIARRWRQAHKAD